MKLDDLQKVTNSLLKIIKTEEDKMKSGISSHSIYNENFSKYKAYIQGSILTLRRRIGSYQDKKHPKLIEDKQKLDNFMFVADTIRIFMDGELQDQQDKINLD